MRDTPIFENDPEGNVVSGSREALVEHLRNGGRIRVALTTEEGPASKRVTVVSPIATFTRFGEAFAQVAWIGSAWQEPTRDLFQFIDPPTNYTLNLSTRGLTHRRVVDFNNRLSSDTVRLGVRWYAE
jgi:hypothetical protein